MKTLAAFAALVVIASSAEAQMATTPAPIMAQQSVPIIAAPAQAYATAVLPANTPITLAINDTITTKGNRWNEGDNFDLTVTQDVRLGQYIVIPRGSRGSGRITWLTNKGAFGKSGKLEFDIEYVEVAGRRIPLSAHFRQEGEGNTVGTIAGVVAVGVFAGFVTGKSGVIPAGREVTARTKEDVPVAFAAPLQASVQSQPYVLQGPAVITAQQAIVAQPVRGTVPRAPAPESAKFGNRRVRCVSCR